MIIQLNYDLCCLLFEVTQRCNALCRHCGSRCEIDSPEVLTKSDIINCLKDVKTNIGTDVMINISGGEPLMRSDIYDITKEITDLGFDWGLVTNGLLLNDERIEKLKDSGMKTITVSIDGFAKTHEMLRGMSSGSFDIIIENLRKLRVAKYLDHIQVTFTVNKHNVHEFEELYRTVLKPLRLDSVRVGFCDPIGRAEDNDDLFLSADEMNEFIVVVNRLNRGLFKRVPIIFACSHYFGNKVMFRQFDCFTGIRSASILYNGDIYVCPNVPRDSGLVQGNIRADSFSEVWKNGFKDLRKRKDTEPEFCKGCAHWNKCRGDSLHTWDFKNSRPKFCYSELFEKEEK